MDTRVSFANYRLIRNSNPKVESYFGRNFWTSSFPGAEKILLRIRNLPQREVVWNMVPCNINNNIILHNFTQLENIDGI